MERDSWRLIKIPAGRGSTQMAIDEAILDAVCEGSSPPVLRLYAWQPACLSLGYSQSVDDVDCERLREKGWDLVRRPTGGQAILHTDEITYAVIGRADHPLLVGNVLESYRLIAAALLAALTVLGVQANFLPSEMPAKETKGPVCFEVPSNYEITVSGRKVLGSAQARRKNGVLQHGSLPLIGDLGRITDVLKFGDEKSRQSSRRRLLERAATLEQITGRAIPWDEAASAFQRGFEAQLGISFTTMDLTDEEVARANALEREKYAHERWTLHKDLRSN